MRGWRSSYSWFFQFHPLTGYQIPLCLLIHHWDACDYSNSAPLLSFSGSHINGKSFLIVSCNAIKIAPLSGHTITMEFLVHAFVWTIIIDDRVIREIKEPHLLVNRSGGLSANQNSFCPQTFTVVIASSRSQTILAGLPGQSSVISLLSTRARHGVLLSRVRLSKTACLM